MCTLYLLAVLLYLKKKKRREETRVPAYTYGTNHLAVLTDTNCNGILSIVQSVFLTLLPIAVRLPFDWMCACVCVCSHELAIWLLVWGTSQRPTQTMAIVSKERNILCRFFVNILQPMKSLHRITSNLFIAVSN